MYKYYVTPSPNGIEGIINKTTTVYISLEKALKYLETKTPFQQSKLYVRRIGSDGTDAGLEQSPKSL